VPYEVFATSDAFNVYAVAPERELTTLTGGLDVLPQLSLAEFDAEVGNPDVIVVPHIPNIEYPENQRLLGWLKRHADGRTVLLSICTGAGELAAAGLLDGREATTHWGDIDRLEKTYPEVRWVRGVRYVDDGDIVSSAGLTSGIDASLHVLARFEGLEAARRVARELNYPNFRFVTSPAVEQYTVRAADAIYLLNAAYRWNRAEAGVLLRDGVGELELASIFDSYGASATTKLVTATLDGRAVRSEHGLQLIPRSATENLKTDRLLVPGREDANVSGRTPATWIGGEGVTYLHVDATRFAFDAPLEDLATAAGRGDRDLRRQAARGPGDSISSKADLAVRAPCASPYHRPARGGSGRAGRLGAVNPSASRFIGGVHETTLVATLLTAGLLTLVGLAACSLRITSKLVRARGVDPRVALP
jgi:putative intracellular protease/amidase